MYCLLIGQVMSPITGNGFVLCTKEMSRGDGKVDTQTHTDTHCSSMGLHELFMSLQFQEKGIPVRFVTFFCSDVLLALD